MKQASCSDVRGPALVSSCSDGGSFPSFLKQQNLRMVIIFTGKLEAELWLPGSRVELDIDVDRERHEKKTEQDATSSCN